MDDSTSNSISCTNPELRNVKGKNLASRKPFLVASIPKALLQNAVAPFISLKQVKVTRQTTGQFVFFLLKVAALDVVRRISEAKFPVLWRGIQGLGLLKCPPFSWLQRWTPFRLLAKSTQEFSRPVLFLSIATTFLGQSKDCDWSADSQANHLPTTDSFATEQIEVVERDHVGNIENANQKHCFELLKEELEKQDIVLPDRLNDDELERFYVAASGQYSHFMSLVKKTIRWRETYYFLSPQELDSWSHLVFWHGFDIQLRPCLVIRLGLACSCLQPDERPRFAQAVVSQVEYGVLHLLNLEDQRITVLMDCEGVPAFGFPVQMMKSCSILVQLHYPTRLASLLVVNLSPVVRVIAKAVIQVLKPVTRKKLHIMGDNYQRALAEYLESVPSFFGGDCTCSHCRGPSADSGRDVVTPGRELLRGEYDGEEEQGSYYEDELSTDRSYTHILRVAVIGLLMVWMIVALLAGFYDPDQQFF